MQIDQVRDADNGSTRAPKSGVTRRQLGAISAVAAMFGATSAKAKSGLGEASASISTPTGSVSGQFFFAPGEKRRGMVMWAEPGFASQAAAQHLVEQGWAVLLVPAPVVQSDSPEIAINQTARACVACLEQQEMVSPARQVPNRSAGVFGDRYTLRSVSAARPRLSFATRGERRSAALWSVMFAFPRLEATPETLEVLSDAVYVTSRLASVRLAA